MKTPLNYKVWNRDQAPTNLIHWLSIRVWLLGCASMLSMMFILQGCDEDDPVVPDQITEQVKQEIGPAGGTLVLSGGITVVIPPDAMSSTKEIVISKYKPTDFFEGDASHFIVIGCAPDGETFSKPVEIYFTAPADLETGNVDGVAGLIDPESGAIEVYPSSGLTVEGKNTLRMETNHFCKYAGHFWEYPPYEAETLKIPHYNQGDSPYCWAACLQMVCEAVRHDPLLEIQDIIGFTGIDEGGAPPYTFRFSSAIAGLVQSRTGVTPDRKIWPIGSAYAMDGYIKDRIALGYPVVVSSPTEQHAFVVVGYQGNTFYINDPASVTYDGQLSYKAKTKAQFKIDEMKIGDKFVTLSIPAPIMTSSHLMSINLTDHGLSFVETKPYPEESPTYFFKYDCTTPKGYSYGDRFNITYDNIPGATKELRFTGLQVSNTQRTQSQTGGVWIYINGLNNKKIYKAFPPANSLNLAANSMINYPFTILTADFADDTPKPTDYTLEAVLMDASGNVLDDVTIKFTMDPAPSMIEFECSYQVQYEDGDFGSVGIDGGIDGEPLRLNGIWKDNIYEAKDEVNYEGIVVKRSLVVTCNENRSKVNALVLRYTLDGVENLSLRLEDIDLMYVDGVYTFDLHGEEACTPLTDAEFGDDLFGAITDYFCDETSFVTMQIHK